MVFMAYIIKKRRGRRTADIFVGNIRDKSTTTFMSHVLEYKRRSVRKKEKLKKVKCALERAYFINKTRRSRQKSGVILALQVQRRN